MRAAHRRALCYTAGRTGPRHTGETVLRALVFALTTLAAAGHVAPVYGARAGCDLKPAWLCYMNSTWWQGRSEDDAKRYIFSPLPEYTERYNL